MPSYETTLAVDAVRASGGPIGWQVRLLDWAVRARAHRVLLLVFGIWILNAFDLLLTIAAHEQGLLHEENPLGRYLLAMGVPSLVLFKVGLVLIGSYPLLRFPTARITEMAAFLILISYALLAFHWSACYELYAMVLSNPDHVLSAAGAAS